MIQNILKTAATAVLIVTFTGCIDSAMMITVNKDGSGEIVQEMYMSPQASAMMQGFGGLEGAEGGGAAGGMDYDEAAYKALAAELGEGVTFLKGGPATKKNGSKGVQVKYSFADITKVKLPMMIDPDDMMDQGEGEKDVLTFGFDKKGGTPNLTINIPQDKDGGKADAAEGGIDADVGAGDANPNGGGIDADIGGQEEMAMAMMKPMLEGMRIRAYVKVNGEITKSDASHIAKSAQSGKKQMITLMDMQLGKLVTDPEKMKKLSALGQEKDLRKVAEALKDVPEIRYELKEKVSIDFK